MLLCILVEALEPFDKVLLLIVRQSLHYIDHKDAITAVTQTWREIQAFVLAIVDDLRLGAPVNVVVKENSFFEKDVHLIVLITLAAAAWLLVDVQI